MKPKNITEWAIMIKEIKGYRCSKCGATTDLISHHVKERSKYPELALDLDNGIVMCRSCHSRHHNSGEYKGPLEVTTIRLPFSLWKSLRNLQTEGKIKSIQQAALNGLRKVVEKNENENRI